MDEQRQQLEERHARLVPVRERARPPRRRRRAAATGAPKSRSIARSTSRWPPCAAGSITRRGPEHVARPEVAVDPRGRLRRPAQRGQPREHRLHGGDAGAGDRAAVGRQPQQRREPVLAVERGPVVRGRRRAARAGRAGTSRPARRAAGRRRPARRRRGRAPARARAPRRRAGARRATRARGTPGRAASTAGTRSPPASPSQRSPAASAAYSPGAAPSRALTNARFAALELQPPGGVEVAAGDRLRPLDAAPERGRRGARRSQPAGRPQVVEQPAAGRLDEVEHVLEAVVAAVVGVGHVEVGGPRRRRVELPQQVDLRPRVRRQERLAGRAGCAGRRRGSGRSPRSRRAPPAAPRPRARCRAPAPPRSRAGRAGRRRASRRCPRCRPRRRPRAPRRGGARASPPRRSGSGRCCPCRRRAGGSRPTGWRSAGVQGIAGREGSAR